MSVGAQIVGAAILMIVAGPYVSDLNVSGISGR